MMKSIFIYNRFLSLMLLSVLLIGCKASRQAHSQAWHTKTVTDTLYIEKTTPVFDTIYLSMPQIRTIKPDCDSLCQRELQKVLATFSFQKQSGANHYGLYYDKYKSQLVLYQNLKAQFNQYQSKHSLTTDKQIKEIPVPYVPLWVKVLAYIGAVAILYFIFKISRKVTSMF